TPEAEPRRSKRSRTAKNYGDDFITSFLTSVDNLDLINDLSTNVYLTEPEPTTYEEAMNSMEASFWKEAADSEIQSIMSKHTWELVDLPKGCKAIGCKWIFKRKLRTDGSVERYKARLVIKGYSQKSGPRPCRCYTGSQSNQSQRPLLPQSTSLCEQAKQVYQQSK
ncbi:Retrovirus-related Pol polyprotein from transposon RE2, partial [Linum grandiflorum]